MIILLAVMFELRLSVADLTTLKTISYCKSRSRNGSIERFGCA
jgi:hypothetical protein